MNGYNPYFQNPYASYQQMPQQFPQQVSTPMNNNKVVDSRDVVKIADIPLDGNMYYFPKADGTMVYGKRWLPNGQTQIIEYKADLSDVDNSIPSTENSILGANNDFVEAFEKRMNGIEQKLDALLSTKTTRKKVSADDSE